MAAVVFLLRYCSYEGDTLPGQQRYLSHVLSTAAAFWKLIEIGMEPAPADRSPGPAGDRALIRSTIKVIAISAALCLKGTGLQAEKRSPTTPPPPPPLSPTESVMYLGSVPP